MVNQISLSIDNKELSVVVFQDLSNTFDIVNYQILLKKLEHGIRGVALKWIVNYLIIGNDMLSLIVSHLFT